MEPGLVISFLGASVILTLMPGPDNIFVLTESLTKGQRNGIAISLGLSLGVLIHTFAAATGLSIIIQKSAITFSVIKYLGAAYLFYLAYQAFRENKPFINWSTNTTGKEDKKVIALVKKGFLMNILNPKVSLFFIAFLPQFITKNGMNITLQMLVLGAIFMVQALLIFSGIAILSGKLTRYVTTSRFWNITKWSKITVLSILGITLALSKK
ncbi:LysE family translocator [Ascidiimonas aurantiaca]|uniref:LysE family translocator n=1 Tax=Ascidiimonas aurantiaca TaxID=1685432 RepID=UPI0030EF27A9